MCLYIHAVFSLHSLAFSSLISCVFPLLEPVFVYIFIEGVTCLIVELWTAGSVLYNISCDLTIPSKINGPMRDPFGKREREQRAGLFLFSVIIFLARKVSVDQLPVMIIKLDCTFSYVNRWNCRITRDHLFIALTKELKFWKLSKFNEERQGNLFISRHSTTPSVCSGTYGNYRCSQAWWQKIVFRENDCKAIIPDFFEIIP